jgi:hypothetical protein
LLVQGGLAGGDPFRTEVAGAIPPAPHIITPANPAPAYSNAPASAYPNEPQGGYYQQPNNAYNSPAQSPAYNNNPNPYNAQPQPAYYQPQQPAPVARKKGSAARLLSGCWQLSWWRRSLLARFSL